MKKLLLFSLAIFMFLTFQTDVRSQMSTIQKSTTRPKVGLPVVPRVSAYEAYVKVKAGKAIIIQAGGIKYERRHILGAFNYDSEGVQRGDIKFPKFPRRGIEIFTYCYWGPKESAGVGLASYMIKKLGYRNVKTVRGGGGAMEKFFDHYHATHYGGKIIKPRTGQIIDIRR